MKYLTALTITMVLACSALPVHAATYAELNTEAQESHRAAEKNQADAKALFDKGDKAAGCVLMMTVVSQRKRTRDILMAVKESFDKGQGSKASRALFLTFP